MQPAQHAQPTKEGPSNNDVRCRWYVAYDGRTEGPYAYNEVLKMVRQGQLSQSHYVWRPGFEHWIALTSRSDFRAVFPGRPSLGLVPSLDEASALVTEDVKLTDDLLEIRSDGEVHPPPLPSPSAEEAFFIEMDAGASATLATLPEVVFDTSVDDGSQIEENFLSEFRPLSRKAQFIRAGLLGGVLAGFAGVIWMTEPEAITFEAIPAPRLGEARLLHPQPQTDRPNLGAKPKMTAVRLTPSQRIDSATAESNPPLTEDLSWLNERRDSREPKPKTIKVSSARMPRRFNVESQRPEAVIEPSSSNFIENYSEQVGRVVQTHLPRLARCAQTDRLWNTIPAGTRIVAVVEGGGQVQRVELEGAPPQIAACLRRHTQDMEFPPIGAAQRWIEIRFARQGTVRTHVHQAHP